MQARRLKTEMGLVYGENPYPFPIQFEAVPYQGFLAWTLVHLPNSLYYRDLADTLAYFDSLVWLLSDSSTVHQDLVPHVLAC
jgi:hypothetical protein